ncbi:MAG TPA: hypothetical protein VLC79_09375 [Cellvibrio sp.]|nr:hypothetical protein [Cellvibrio sp.]
MNSFLRTISFFTLIISSGCVVGKSDNSFQPFWTEFRAAAIKNDYATLEKFTKFPLEVRGVHDSMPVQYFKKDEFKEIFNRLMEQKIYPVHDEELVLTSMKTIVKNTELAPDAKNGEEYRMEQLAFEYIDGQWFFTNAYLEE